MFFKYPWNESYIVEEFCAGALVGGTCGDVSTTEQFLVQVQFYRNINDFSIISYKIALSFAEQRYQIVVYPTIPWLFGDTWYIVLHVTINFILWAPIMKREWYC